MKLGRVTVPDQFLPASHAALPEDVSGSPTPGLCRRPESWPGVRTTSGSTSRFDGAAAAELESLSDPLVAQCGSAAIGWMSKRDC